MSTSPLYLPTHPPTLHSLTIIINIIVGASNSGKTTIAKQIRSLHTKGLTEEELWEFKPIIINTALGTIKTLKQQAQENEVYTGETEWKERRDGGDGILI